MKTILNGICLIVSLLFLIVGFVIAYTVSPDVMLVQTFLIMGTLGLLLQLYLYNMKK